MATRSREGVNHSAGESPDVSSRQPHASNNAPGRVFQRSCRTADATLSFCDDSGRGGC